MFEDRPCRVILHPGTAEDVEVVAANQAFSQEGEESNASGETAATARLAQGQHADEGAIGSGTEDAWGDALAQPGVPARDPLPGQEG